MNDRFERNVRVRHVDDCETSTSRRRAASPLDDAHQARFRGPRHPNRAIFVSVALFGSAIGIVTADLRAFALAIVLSTLLLCAGYALIRRRLGWQPLSFDYLFALIHVLSPF